MDLTWRNTGIWIYINVVLARNDQTGPTATRAQDKRSPVDNKIESMRSKYRLLDRVIYNILSAIKHGVVPQRP